MNSLKQFKLFKTIHLAMHEVFAETIYKVALPSRDDKKVIREDGNQTLAQSSLV